MKIYIDGWKSHLCFSAAHILPGCGKCSRLHGHTYALHAEITGEIDGEGMLIDFTLIKKNIKQIADEFDHHIIIPKEQISKQDLKGIMVVTGEKKYLFPTEDCIILPIKSSTAEHLAQYILDRLCKILDFPHNISGVSLGVDEGIGQGVWIHRELK